MEEFLTKTYLNNPIQDYLIVFGIIVVGILLIRIFRKGILNKLKKWSANTETDLDDYVVSGIERFGLPLANYTLIYAALNYLNFSAKPERILHTTIKVVVAYYVIRIVISVFKHLLESHVLKQEQGEAKVKQMKGVVVVATIIIWLLGGVFLFNNMGYNVTAIITGLGIGGIAIALAAQNILGDLFNYFVIFFDQPFEIGDFIVFDDKNGVVEYMGIKTTRLKTLSGEQLIVANSDLTKSRVHNFKRMRRRRILFTLGVIYQTSLDNIKEIPGILKSIIEENSNATFDRAHFSSYGNFSLNYEIVYFVESPDYNQYMDLHQKINFRIYEAFQQKGIEFAYPSQTIFMAKEETVKASA